MQECECIVDTKHTVNDIVDIRKRWKDYKKCSIYESAELRQ